MKENIRLSCVREDCDWTSRWATPEVAYREAQDHTRWHDQQSGLLKLGRRLVWLAVVIAALVLLSQSADAVDRPATKAESLAYLQAAEHLRLIGIPVPYAQVRVTLDGAECGAGKQPAYACVASDLPIVWFTREAAEDARKYHAALKATTRRARAANFYSCFDWCLFAPSVGLHEATHVARFAVRSPFDASMFDRDYEEGLADAIADDQLPRMILRLTGARVSLYQWGYLDEMMAVKALLPTKAARLAAVLTP